MSINEVEKIFELNSSAETKHRFKEEEGIKAGTLSSPAGHRGPWSPPVWRCTMNEAQGSRKLGPLANPVASGEGGNIVLWLCLGLMFESHPVLHLNLAPSLSCLVLGQASALLRSV